MRKPKIAIVGATGMVGRMFIKVMEERKINADIRLFASKKSEGTAIKCFGEMTSLKELREDSFDDGFDYALFSAGKTVSEKYVPIAAAKGTVVIDNSSMWRMDGSVPLVVPEVNPEDIWQHNGIIANPNCSTIQAVAALAPIHRHYGIEKIVYTTFQAVSGAGRYGTEDLENGVRQHVVGGKAETIKFPCPIFGNCIPQIDSFLDDGSTAEEQKMINETRKILHDDGINISATCVRVPVFNSHSESIYLELKHEFRLCDIKSLLSKSAGLKIADDDLYPTPLGVSGKDEVYIGRLRRDLAHRNGLSLWVVADNLRKGAATNAVQILELLLRNNRKGDT